MSSASSKYAIVGVALIAATVGWWATKKQLDKHDEIEAQKHAACHPKPGQRFGIFKCNACDKQWTSYFAWIGEMQKCDACNLWLTPVEMRKLEGEVIKNVKITNRHDPSLCTRCVKYQSLCYEV